MLSDAYKHTAGWQDDTLPVLFSAKYIERRQNYAAIVFVYRNDLILFKQNMIISCAGGKALSNVLLRLLFFK